MRPHPGGEERMLPEDEAARIVELVERVPAGMWIEAYEDAQPSKALRLYSNDRVEEITGYGRQAWDDDPDLWMKVIHPEDQQRVVTETWQTTMRGEPYCSEFRLIHSDGHIVNVFEQATVVRDSENHRDLWFGVTVDLGERDPADGSHR
jgi:PAS domain S-box-containing protein